MAGIEGIDRGFSAGTSGIPSSRVEISVSCRKLRDLHIFSKSDPMCVMYLQDLESQRYIEHGRTETIQNNLNPDFVNKFVIDYLFEEPQRLKFEVYDIDTETRNLKQQDYIGEIELTLGEIVGAPGGCVFKKLKNKLKPNVEAGEIVLRFEELSSSKEFVTFELRGTTLLEKLLPFLTFYKANEDGSFTVLYRTEVFKKKNTGKSISVGWNTFIVPIKTFGNGDYDRTLKMECHGWNSSGNHKLIGVFFTNLRELRALGYMGKSLELKDLKGTKPERSGWMHVSCDFHIQDCFSFSDYIRGGMQMNFTVAIDFTASNGNPNSPESLHYLNPNQLNQYAAAITAVGEIIQDYDSDNMFPALGFGARLPDNTVSHDFPLNFQKENPSCPGVQGILSAYYQALHRVQLDGPTKFAPVINHVAKFAGDVRRGGSEYFVLLIITNGVMADMLQTKSAIFNASPLPMSIIIVGVGDADFKEMNILDGTDERLSYRGLYAERDIVQFVPFRDFLKVGTNINVYKAFLAKTVLGKVSDQVLSYMKRNRYKPQPPVPSPMLGHQVNSQQEPPPSYNDAIRMGLTPDYNAAPPPYGS